MDIVAIIAIRNDRPYLANCLNHLINNELPFAVIDNESVDDVEGLLRSPHYRRHLVEYSQLPYTGAFDKKQQIEAKERLISRLGADWVVDLDVDEVMHPYSGRETLREVIERVDREGWNVINFDEFVFLPLDDRYIPVFDGWQPIKLYYFFEPMYPRLMRAYNARCGFSSLKHGGHVLDGADLRLCPENMVLRHYAFRSQEHALEKHTKRVVSQGDLARGWHANRVGFSEESFIFPLRSTLKILENVSDRCLDRSDPKRKHYWEW